MMGHYSCPTSRSSDQRLTERRAGLALIATLVWLTAACGPSIQSARFTPGVAPPARAGAGEVLVFSTRLPECAFEEIGLVTGKPRGFWTSLETVLENMRERAREMGGDAIVGLGTSEVVTGASQAGGSVSLQTADRLAGTVVRFEDADCRR